MDKPQSCEAPQSAGDSQLAPPAVRITGRVRAATAKARQPEKLLEHHGLRNLTTPETCQLLRIIHT